MIRNQARLRLVDGALPMAGLGLLVAGAAGVSLALPLAWTALGLAFIGWVAEADGLHLPRPGRLPIRSYGCWETPLAFAVLHRDRELVFAREEDETGAWASEYTVRERPPVPGADLKFEMPMAATGGWTLVGRTPVAGLRFEHHQRVIYVTRRSLERALGRSAPSRA